MKHSHTSPIIKNKTAGIFHKIMLIAMLHNTFIAPCQTIVIDYFTLEKPRHYSGAVLNSHEIINPEIQENAQYSMPVSVVKPATGQFSSNNYVRIPQARNTIEHASFEADIKEGSIGVTAEHPLDSPTDNLFKFNIDGILSPQSKVYLTYDLYGVQDALAVSRSINDRLSTGGHMVKYQASWTPQKEEIDASWLQPGENKILFTIAKGASYQYKVRNIRIEVDNSASKNLNSLVIYQPAISYTHNNQMYVKGFIKNAAPDAKVYIEDSPLSIHNGAFEGTITLTEAIKNRHFVVVKAIDGKGLVGQEIIMVDNAEEADRLFPLDENLLSTSTYFKAAEAGNIAIDGASVQVSGNALKADKNITAIRLRAIDIPPMSSGMINVTKGGTAYRFLPDGTVFDEPVSLSLAYDEKLIPPGHNAKEIHTYYFNTDSKTWIAVVRDSVNEKGMMIISKTNHFTDYINGIIQTPESPETAAFTPTMMSDIKAADPSAEMTIISPPEVSQKGDANISYPIKIPAGTRGMQPQLGVQYSNEGGNGWLGVGWSLNIPAISIDTRWGVPVLDPDNETEMYTLGGEQLMYPKIDVGSYNFTDWMPNRHYDGHVTPPATYTTQQRPREADLIFTPRKQGSFATMQRLGASPDEYYWKVTGTDGTISWYGGRDGEGVVENTVLRSPGGIVHWGLYMTEDVHGNYVKYTYNNNTIDLSGSTGNANLEGGKIFIPESILYTGFGTPAPEAYENDIFGYKIHFITTSGIKSDATINSRLGIKQVDPYLLSEILVENLKLSTPEEQHFVRKYKFGYNENGGRFKRAQLISIGEYDGADQEFNTHRFDYYNDVPDEGNNAFFSAGVDVNFCNDGNDGPPDSDNDGTYDDNECSTCPATTPEVEPRCYRLTFPMPLTDVVYNYHMNWNATLPTEGTCPYIPFRIKDFYYDNGSLMTFTPSTPNNLFVTHFDGVVTNMCTGGGYIHPENPAFPTDLKSWLTTAMSSLPVSDFQVVNYSDMTYPASVNGTYNVFFSVSFLSAEAGLDFGCHLESEDGNSNAFTSTGIDSELHNYVFSGTDVPATISLGSTALGTFNLQTQLNQFITAFHTEFPNAEIIRNNFDIEIIIPSTDESTIGNLNVNGSGFAFTNCKGTWYTRPAAATTENKLITPNFFESKKKNFEKSLQRSGSQADYTFELENSIAIGNPECPSFLNTDFIFEGNTPSFDPSYSILGSTYSKARSSTAYFGGGIGCKWYTKSTTFGYQMTWSKDRTTSRIGMVDINGDGLDDVIFNFSDDDDGDDYEDLRLYYRPHTLERTYNEENEPEMTHSFGVLRPIMGVSSFYKSTTSSKSKNFQVTFGVKKIGGFLGKDKNESESTTNIYFTDANSDGLIDIVKNGVVYFNHLEGPNHTPTFTIDSEETENMLIKAADVLVDEPAEESEVDIPAYDVVKVWEAPADGKIKIENTIQLLDTNKTAKVTIEKKAGPSVINQCFTTDFTVPYENKALYNYDTWYDKSFYVDLSPASGGHCDSQSFRLKSMVLDGETFSPAVTFTPTNPNTLIYTNGSESAGYLSQCPTYVPYGYTSFESPDPVIVSPGSAQKIYDWLEDGPLLNVPYTGFFVENNSGIYVANDNYRTLHWLYLSFNTTFDFDVLIEQQNAKWYATTYADIPFSYCPCPIDRDDLGTIPVGIETNVYVNTVLLPGGPFNLVDDFESFKDAFETEYGVTLNYYQNSPNDGTSYTINTYDDTLFSTISFVPVGAPEDTTTFSFDVSGQCDTFRPANKMAVKTKEPNNIKLSNEAQTLALKKWEAEGNDLKTPLIQPDEKFQFLIADNEKNQGLNSAYTLTVKKNIKSWADEKGIAIKDSKELSALNNMLPADFDQEIQNMRKSQEEKTLANRKENQIKAQKWLKEYHDKKKVKQASNLRTETEEDCVTYDNELCVLFGDILNNSHTSVTNTITNGSTSCSTSDSLAVKKGDRIYFRVHSNDDDNPRVNWNPKVSYTDTAMAAMEDQDGQLLYSTSYSDGFILSKYQPAVFPDAGMGNPASATITWPDVVVDHPSDEVVFEIFRTSTTDMEDGTDTSSDELLYRKVCPSNTSTTVSPTSSSSNTTYLDPINKLGNIDMTVDLLEDEAVNSKQFYFKVSSSSNVKWKDYKWEPKIECKMEAPMLGEDGTTVEATLKTTQMLYPNVDYSIYKSYPCASPYSLFDTSSIVGYNDLEIKAYMNDIFFGDIGVHFWFVVKNNGKVIVKKEFSRTVNSSGIDFDSHWEPNSDAVPLGTLTDPNIEIGFYFDDTNLLDDQISNAAKLVQSTGAVKIFYNSNDSSIIVPTNKLNIYHKPNPKFGPMLRQWGQFMYSPELVTGATAAAPYGYLIKENVLKFDTAQLESIQNAVEGPDFPDEETTDPEGDLDDFETSVGFMNYMALWVADPSRGVIGSTPYEKWIGLHEQSYTTANGFRAGGIEESVMEGFDIEPYAYQDVLETGAFAINKKSTGVNKNLSAGINLDVGPGETPVGSVGANGSKTLSANSKTSTDYIDINGDRYPDILTSEELQLTTSTGGLHDTTAAREGALSRSESSSKGFGATGSYSKGGDPGSQSGDKKGPRFVGFRGNSGAGLSASFSRGSSKTSSLWTDINGDGLADLLQRDESGEMSVTLNEGKGADSQVDGEGGTSWEVTRYPFDSRTENISMGLGINKWNGSLEAGISATCAWNSTNGTMIDMNGDGLLDYVYTENELGSSDGLRVMMNQGNNFVDFGQQWSTRNLNRESVSVGATLNAGATVALTWPPILGFCIKFPVISLSTTLGSSSTNKTQKSITDFDGDGYPDIVEQDSDSGVKVYSSQIRRTDMLKTVYNPLGGSFVVDYKVQPVTYNNPHAKWVMSDLIINDGYDRTNDGRDTYRKHFEYENGKYDRRERDFYGYETVKTIDYSRDFDDNPTTVYRTSVSKYYNDSYFMNGLLKESYVMKGDDENQKYSGTRNTYTLRMLSNDNREITDDEVQPNYDVGGTEGRRSVAVFLIKTENLLYELSEDPLITTVVNMEYDHQGRVVKYRNLGDMANGSDDYESVITYHDISTLEEKNITKIPSSIKVYGGGTLYRSRSTTVDENNGNILMVHTDLGSGNAVTQMEYYENGNLKKIIYPENGNHQSMFYEYEYDLVYSKYVTKTTDAYGYFSTAVYNSDFDKVETVTDIGNNDTKYDYDTFGRMTQVLGPNEIKNSVPYTIKFEYFPRYVDMTDSAYNCVDEGSFMPVALTSHHDDQHYDTKPNDIQTVTFMDGLGRAVQVKKDVELNVGSTVEPDYKEYMTASGVVMYDEFARSVRQYHPKERIKECDDDLTYFDFDIEFYSETQYDELDRPVKAIDADSKETNIVYSIDTDDDGVMAIKTHTDVDQGPQHIISETYKDVSGRVISTMNDNDGDPLWTKFKYDAIGQLLSYEDAEELTTHYVYDLAGRKSSISHPDSGVTKFEYDNAGHLVKSQTANLAWDTSLAVANRWIKYSYYFGRVTDIKYPSTSSGDNLSNVHYVYGDTTESTGRVIKQTDASGSQTFEYGKMGEMIHNVRVVVGPNIPSRIFSTSFNYDSWNRLISMVYPDGEEVTYTYDLGGNLNSMSGDDGKNVTDYIKRIDYDHFEQRTYMKYGNDTENFYTYTEKLRRLDNLKAMTSGSETMFDNHYSYDFVGNVTSVYSSAGALANTFGGSYGHTFTYDASNRLKSAYGNFTGDTAQATYGNDYQSEYNVALTYNETHGIESKTQTHYKNYAGSPDPVNTYDNAYEYYEGTHKVETVTDSFTSTIETYKYDDNGNVISVSSGAIDRELLWDESNRLRVFVNYNSPLTMQHYIYDAAGERVLKANTDIESVYNNGTLIAPSSVTVNGYTTYASGFLVIDPHGVYSKHYYAGSQRVVSRIGDAELSIFNLTEEMPRGTASGEGGNPEAKLRQAQTADLQGMMDKLNLGTVKFREFKAKTYAEMEQAFKEETDTEDTQEFQRAGGGGSPMYYYHPDHLGTSTFLTDSNGDAYQFFLNLPFGETMAQQNPLSSYKSPYLFNAKELDEETGLYYYGARYYDPKVSVWMSVDPLAEQAPDWTPYRYCFNNPIRYTDPTGMGEGEFERDANGEWVKISNLGDDMGIDFYHVVKDDKNGIPQSFTCVTDRKNNWNVINGGTFLMTYYENRNVNVDWTTIFDEWKDGTGPEKSLFEGDHPANLWIENNNKFQEALADFRDGKKLKESINVEWGAWDALTTPEGDNQAQMMGSYRANFYKLGDKTLALLTDTKSKTSFYLHLPWIKDYSRGAAITNPSEIDKKETTTYQTYLFLTK